MMEGVPEKIAGEMHIIALALLIKMGKAKDDESKTLLRLAMEAAYLRGRKDEKDEQQKIQLTV